MIALYGGVLGFAQDLEVTLDTAWHLRDVPDIQFVLIGDGPAKRGAVDMASDRGLRNVQFLPFVPPAEYAKLVTLADCGLVTLKSNVSSIPSKIGTFLSMGKPIIAALPDGDAANLVSMSGGGIRFPAGDSEGMARAIVALASCPDVYRQLSANGKAFARKVLSAEKAIDAWDELLRRL